MLSKGGNRVRAIFIFLKKIRIICFLQGLSDKYFSDRRLSFIVLNF